MKTKTTSIMLLAFFLASMFAVALTFSATTVSAQNGIAVGASLGRYRIYDEEDILVDSVSGVLDGYLRSRYDISPERNVEIVGARIEVETPFEPSDFHDINSDPYVRPTIVGPVDGNYTYEWDFGTLPPGQGAMVSLPTNFPVEFDPGFDCQRIWNPWITSESMTQTLTLEFTPVTIDFHNVNPSVQIPKTDEASPTIDQDSISTDPKIDEREVEWHMWFDETEENIEVNWGGDPKLGVTYTFSVNVTVQNKLFPEPIFYKPSAGFGANFDWSWSSPENSVMIDDDINRDGEDESSVKYYGTGAFNWQEHVQSENSVTLPWFSSGFELGEPAVSFTYSPTEPMPAETVTLDASASYDLDGEILSYEWDFGDGTPRVVDGDPVTTHTYAEPGTYIVTLTVRDAMGNESTHSITITVLHAEAIREPRSLYIVAQVAIAGTAVIAATAALASLGGLGQSFNSAVSKLPIPDKLKDFLQFYGEAVFETVDKVKLETLEKAPFITKGELAALGISALIMTVVFGYVEANGLSRFLKPSVLATVIPSTLLSVCVVSVAEEVSEALCARTCRVYRQYGLWMYGLGAFLISGFLFLFPFASPGITRYQSEEISNKTKGLIVLSKMLVLLTLTIPFAGLFMLGFKIIGDAGLLLTLMTVCYSLVPVKPLVGKAVFDYRKEVSLIAFISAGILFYSCTVNLLPNATYLAVGIVSMFLATITLNQLRKAHPK